MLAKWWGMERRDQKSPIWRSGMSTFDFSGVRMMVEWRTNARTQHPTNREAA